MDFKLTKSDIYLVLIYYAFAIPIACLDYADYADKMELFYEVLLFVTTDTLCVYVIVYHLFPRYFPERRYFMLLLTTIVFISIVGYVAINFYCLFASCSGNPLFSFRAAYVGLNLVVESFPILGIILLGKKLFDAQIKFLKVEKEKRESELRFLKSQIDPHFLFNNLNTVDSLIDTNPTMAKTYLNKLAQLYRYLISSKDQEVVLLNEELEFAKNYMYLIESRYGKAFQFEIINELAASDSTFIPPGALQTLLENIVKHNQASPLQPIKSTILIQKDSISVQNNLKKKEGKVDSTGTGLDNLRSRYRLLTDKAIRIVSDEFFRVELPIIRATT